MHDVLASLGERIKSHEQGVGGDLPLVLGLLLVLVVSILELGANVQSESELVISDLWLIGLDESEDGWSIDGSTASVDDGVTDLSDQDNKSSWGVVMLRVGPDEQNGVHDWNEKVNHLIQLLSGIGKLVEQTEEGLKVEEILSCLRSCDLNFLLKLTEGTGVGRLVLLQEFKNFLNSLGTQLLANGDEVLALILPEVDLGDWVWVFAVLKGAFRVSLEDLLDLFGPVNDGTLE